MFFPKKITTSLKTAPVHLFVLPVFFILNIYIQFAGLLNIVDVGIAFLWITGGLVLTYIILRLLYRQKVNAAIATTVIGVLFLFFGNLKDIMAGTSLLEPVSRYKILLPLLAILTSYFLYRLYRSRPLLRFNLFLNILFLFYAMVELGRLAWLPAKAGQGNVSSATITPLQKTGGSYPSIYYIIADCYPATSYQREVLGASHNQLDDSLQRRGFFVVNDPSSNYKYTAFSMASVFSLDYLHWLRHTIYLKPHHYNKAISAVKGSPVFSVLQQQGYDMHNLSIFDLPGHSALMKENFLSTTGMEMIFYNTLYKSVRREVIPAIFPSLRDDLTRKQQKIKKEHLGGFRSFNNRVLDSIRKITGPVTGSPRFVYTHLEMPHYPYFNDSIGRPYPDGLVFGPEMITNKERFRNYISYTNTVLTGIVDSIVARHNGQAVIIVQSDHGFNETAGSKKEDGFRNYTAMYFPDRNYSMLYHGMSNVNTFRIIFNKYFGQQLPLLPDSTIHLK